MTPLEFQEQLRQAGAYTTAPEGRKRLRDRLAGRGNAGYYARVLSIVVRADLRAVTGRYDQAAWARSSFQTLQAVEACGTRVTIEGLQSRAGLKGPVVYISNHMSMLETFLLPCICLTFGDVAIVLKESLLRYPVFGPIVRAVRPIGVTRANPREDLRAVLERGAEALKSGRSVLVFPQHTRRTYFDASEFNTLGVKLARRGDVPVVPIALRTDFQGVGRRFRDIGPVDPSKAVRFRFGPAMAVAGNGRETNERVIEFISDSLKAFGVAVCTANEVNPEEKPHDSRSAGQPVV